MVSDWGGIISLVVYDWDGIISLVVSDWGGIISQDEWFLIGVVL